MKIDINENFIEAGCEGVKVSFRIDSLLKNTADSDYGFHSGKPLEVCLLKNPGKDNHFISFSQGNTETESVVSLKQIDEVIDALNAIKTLMS